MLPALLWALAAAAAHGLLFLAYVPRLVMRVVFWRVRARYGAVNAFHAKTSLASYRWRHIPRPSPDLLYSAAKFDLRGGRCVLVSLRVSSTYRSVSFYGGDSVNFFTLTDRGRTPGSALHALLVHGGLPASLETLGAPPDAQVIECPEPEGLMIERVFVVRRQDVATVAAEARAECRELRAPSAASTSGPRTTASASRLRRKSAALLLPLLLGAGWAAAWAASAPLLWCACGALAGVAAVFAALMLLRPLLGRRRNGSWVFDPAVGSAASSATLRAAVSLLLLLALSADEAVYFAAFHDARGAPLRCDRAYRLSVGRMPARWWSVTAYGWDSYLMAPAGEEESYSVNSASAALDARGLAEIALARARPPSARNWIALGAKDAPFNLVLRLYHPDAGALERFEALELPRIESVE